MCPAEAANSADTATPTKSANRCAWVTIAATRVRSPAPKVRAVTDDAPVPMPPAKEYSMIVVGNA